jgi:hypothetical protein
VIPSILVLLFLLLLHSTAFAQPSPFGRRFLIAFPDTMRNRTGAVSNPLRDDARIILFASDTARVTITGPGYSKSLVVLPSSSSVVSMTDPAARPSEIYLYRRNIPSMSVFEVTSDRPVSTYCYFETPFGSEAFTPLPVESWGKEYYAMTLPNQLIFDVPDQEENVYSLRAPSQIAVIASENGTSVTVEATDSVIGPRVRTIALDAGQAYLIESASGDTLPGDLSGTRITADKPIGVLSGNTRTQGGVGATMIQTPSGNSAANTTIEWLFPTGAEGETFVYRPVTPVAEQQTEELVRIYATAPGTTTVVSSNGGPSQSIPQGKFAQFSSLTYRSGDSAEAFALHTDRPAEGVVISGAFALSDTSNPGYLGAKTWSPAMATLIPHEEWITFGRFHAPDFPPSLKHYCVIVADSAARLWLDGRSIASNMRPVVGSPFRHGRLEVSPGDHSLRSVGGAFSAIAFGQNGGRETFAPPVPHRDEDSSQGARLLPAVDDERLPSSSGGASILHKSVYTEYISIAYAYPVLGRSDEAIPPDSLEFSRIDRCDSTVVTVTRVGPLWTSTPLSATLDPASINTDAEIVPSITFGIVSGLVIRFTPHDPNVDANGSVTVTTLPGRTWSIPYSYRADAFAIDPDPVELLGVTAGVQRIVQLTVTNRKPFTATAIISLLHEGTSGFSFPDHGLLTRTLAPNGSYQLPLAFTGSEPEKLYIDTLIVYNPDCFRTDTIPVSARTAPPNPKPIPLITGYDWKERLVRSTNDTLSFISNAGSLDFTIGVVTILDDPDGAFSLVPPGWRSIPGVAPGKRIPTGIRFTPPSGGNFTATIALVTGDGDTARADLHGIGALPRIAIPDLDLGDLCISLARVKDTVMVIANDSSVPLRIDAIEVTGSSASSVALDTAAIGLPRTLQPNGTLPLPLHLAPTKLGPIDATVVARSSAAAGDSVGRIDGYVVSCSNARLAVDDHDFDSVFITLTGQGFVVVRNLGGGDVLVTGMRLVDDTAGAFRITSPGDPFVVRDGDTVHVECEFTPLTVGLKTARIEFDTEVGRLYANLRGVGKKLIVPASIGRDYHAKPGEEITIYIDLESSLAEAPVDSLEIALGYDADLLDFLGITDSSLVAGWESSGAVAGDSLRFTIRGLKSSPEPGHLLGLNMLTRFSLHDSSELPFTIESGIPYVEIVEHPGLFRRDSICGLVDRLFEFTRYRLRLEQNVPNPVERETRIDFEIPFDNFTTLVVYDLIGGERLRLVDGFIPAGIYSTDIPENTLPSGVYYYRLVSGEFTLTRRMIIQ